MKSTEPRDATVCDKVVLDRRDFVRDTAKAAGVLAASVAASGALTAVGATAAFAADASASAESAASSATSASKAISASATASTSAASSGATAADQSSPKSEYAYYQDSRMAAYVDSILRQGIAIEEGDEIIVSAPVSTSRLVDLIAKNCYLLGAKVVNVSYKYGFTAMYSTKYIESDDFDSYVPANTVLFEFDAVAVKNPKLISVSSPTFPAEGEAPSADKLAIANEYNDGFKEKLKALLGDDETYAEFRAREKSWCLIACPSYEWACKVYPEMTPEQALSALWEDVFAFAYLDADSTDGSVAEEKAGELVERAQALDDMGIESLHFQSAQTDLSVKLHEGNRFAAPIQYTTDGKQYQPNIPCYECFAMPDKFGVDGTVAVTRTLYTSGCSIEGIKLTFKDGKLEEWSADTNQDMLDYVIDQEGMTYAGEISLVSGDTPISKTGRVFYTTIFDENAGCHIALGSAYPDYNLAPGAEVDDHVNQSDSHIDFCIGSDDMKVVATLTDGTQKTLLEDGVWAF